MAFRKLFINMSCQINYLDCFSAEIAVSTFKFLVKTTCLW